MPLVFKIFLLLFLQQAKPVLTGQGNLRSDGKSPYTYVIPVPVPTHLLIEADESFLQQAIMVSSAESPTTEISRESSIMFPAMTKVVLRYDSVSQAMRERIEQRLKNEKQITRFEWLIL